MRYKDWKYEARGKWHRCFVWWPVEVGHGGEMAWFQFVERRLDGWGGGGVFGPWLQWSYRLKEGAPEIGFQ